MSLFLVIGVILGAWALLTMLGGERQRRLNDLQAILRAEAEARKAAEEESIPTVSGPSR